MPGVDPRRIKKTPLAKMVVQLGVCWGWNVGFVFGVVGSIWQLNTKVSTFVDHPITGFALFKLYSVSFPPLLFLPL